MASPAPSLPADRAAKLQTQPQALAAIVGYAYQSDLDPAAVVAVAQGEGGLDPSALGHYDPDTQGNPGWSYGPFQLRDPGALPASVYTGPVTTTLPGPRGAPETWAWSQEGIQYAIGQIQGVAAGKTGADAISSIVNGFEHPANPQAEIAGAEARYAKLTAGGSGSRVQIPNTQPPVLNTPVGRLNLAPGGGVNVSGTPGTAKQGGGPATTTAPSNSTNTGIFSLTWGDIFRVLQGILGGVLILLGLFLLARRQL